MHIAKKAVTRPIIFVAGRFFADSSFHAITYSTVCRANGERTLSLVVVVVRFI
jgi:hypothetical protein